MDGVLQCVCLLCREDYSHLYDFINTKNIRVKNKGKVGVALWVARVCKDVRDALCASCFRPSLVQWTWSQTSSMMCTWSE